MELTDENINVIANELARIYAIGWQQHGLCVGEQKNHLSPEEWANCNFQMFTTEAVNLLLKIK